MELKLPNNLNGERIIVEKNNLIVLGANGSGKTRFGAWIENTYFQYVHRISAQKSLQMPQYVSPKSKESAENEFLYGMSHNDAQWLMTAGKKNSRWQQNENVSMLNDYTQLMTLLHTEEYEKSIEFKDNYVKENQPERPITKLDTIKEIWEYVLPHKKLIKTAGKIEVCSVNETGQIYNASEMSDGERVVFYFIGEVMCAKENSTIIIDEPETHLHKSISKKLWDKIEQCRKDCRFIYLTHDIDFVLSRSNCNIIWIKSYLGNEVWDYNLIDDSLEIPEELYYEIIGSRKNIIFIEGSKSSLDYYIYQAIFTNYTVVSAGSCKKVIELTKSFNLHSDFHRITAIGIIDRDRKNKEEIKSLEEEKIFALKVAEIENLFLLEEVIKTVFEITRKDYENSINLIKDKIFEFYIQNIDKQILEYSKYHIKNLIEENVSIKSNNWSEYLSNIERGVDIDKFNEIYTEKQNELNKIHIDCDYTLLLEVFNNKGMIANSNVTNLCGLTVEGYRDVVKSLLKEESELGNRVRNAIKQYMPEF
ncbi:MAG TPA: AAA family ATPase [Clostridiales bacterium]|nr:MAG: hypothetical protein A2Y18_06720 [Clostridiales bacterium GWD2_32_19]HCC08032.1 AAA family ATPase [Clostridiales bacterium]